jgi:hypothetical protein
LLRGALPGTASSASRLRGFSVSGGFVGKPFMPARKQLSRAAVVA